MANSPFKLFEPYGPGDKDIFFGRDAEIFALYHLLQQTRLVLIYGASGTGKTSLISAGLPKAYKLTSWFRISVRRRDDINASFRQELARQLDLEEPVLDLPAAIQELYESRWIPIHLVFDQFEEVFTLGDDAERQLFFRDLQTLLAANLPCKILLSMREEYIGHLYDYEPLVPSLFEKRFRVEPMQDGTVQNVITQMCALHGIELEQPEASATHPSTAQQILQQLREGKQAAHLPYVQVYLHYLYLYAIENLGRAFFDTAGMAAIGQLGNVLRSFIVTRLEEAQRFLGAQKAPEDFAQRLLDEFSTDEGTKRSRKRADLAQSLQVPLGLVQEALLHFSDTAKLLRADEDDVERYEPVHDAIAKQIHELRTAEDKEFKAFARDLQLAYERWQKENEAPERLLSELDLNKAEIYLDRLKKREEYSVWAPYLEQSKVQVKRRKALRRNFNIALVVVAVLALATSIWALILNNKANTALENSCKFLLEDAEQLILNLDYAGASAKLRQALSLNVRKKEVATALLEPAFWYAETGNYTRAASMLETIARLLHKRQVLGMLQKLRELPGAVRVRKRNLLRDCVKGLDAVAYEHLQRRYYPVMLRVTGGEFMMGDVMGDSDTTDSDEKVHPVRLSDFEMATTETTVWQWSIFCATTGQDITDFFEKTWSDSGNNPAINVSWDDAVAYANWLNARYWLAAKPPLDSAITGDGERGFQLDLKARGFRLPTEAEWEYAAREGGKKVRFGNGKNIADPQEINFNPVEDYKEPYSMLGEYRGRTSAAGSLNSPNALGLNDMSGNVWEWCWDWYGTYPSSASNDPQGATGGSYRVLRGGSWNDYPADVRVAYRADDTPVYRYNVIGFRLARAAVAL